MRSTPLGFERGCKHYDAAILNEPNAYEAAP